MTGGFADVSPELDGVSFNRETKEVRGFEWNSGHDQVLPYFGFDHSALSHWKPEIPKPHTPHIPHLPTLVVKPHDSYANKPDDYHHKPSILYNDDKNEPLHPVVYPVYYPGGFPYTWDHALLDNLYYPGHSPDNPNPCSATTSTEPSTSTEQSSTENPNPCSGESCTTEHSSTEEPPLRSTQKPFLPYPIVGYPFEHLPVFHTTRKPQPETAVQHFPTSRPEHQTTTDTKPNPSKPDKPTFTSIFPNFWPFYTRQKDKDSQAAEGSHPVSTLLYPFYRENK